MNRCRPACTSVTVVAGLVGLLLLCGLAGAQPVPISYPNPAPDAYAKLTGSFVLTRTLTFTDPAVADGGNPTGTTYQVLFGMRAFIDPGTGPLVTLPGGPIDLTIISTHQPVPYRALDLNPIQPPPPAPAIPADFLITVDINGAALTKTTNGSQTFTVDPSSVAGTLIRNRYYLWRVDVNPGSATPTQGTEWKFFAPMNEPCHNYSSPFNNANPYNTSNAGNTRVSTYPRLVWEPKVGISGPTVLEELFFVDATFGDPIYNWVLPPPDPGNPNTTLVRKIYDPRADPSSRASVREFWVPDDGYARLVPGRVYRWRIGYFDWNQGKWLGSGPSQSMPAWIWSDDGTNSRSQGWYFTTVPTVPGDLGDIVTESAIVYWESQYGTNSRDPEEQYYQFKDDALVLQDIHQNVHSPTKATILIGSEELAASYNGPTPAPFNNSAGDPNEIPWVPTILGWDGWDRLGSRAARATAGFTLSPFSAADQIRFREHDRYSPWVANSLRTMLFDAAVPSQANQFYDVKNLQYIVLLGDAQRVAPSFYYHYAIGPTNFWVPTDFFYSTQGVANAVGTTPHYQVSRIPIRKTPYRTIKWNNALNVYQPYPSQLPVDIYANPLVEQAWLQKIRNYANVLNSDSKKSAAFASWFNRAVVVAGSTEYRKWYQFFNGYAQHLLAQQVDVGGGQLRSAFGGLKVRKYDLFSTDNEALTDANVLRHVANPVQDDVPGFLYLLTRGLSTGRSGTIATYDAIGDSSLLTLGLAGADIRAENFFPFYLNNLDPTDGRRPLVVSCASVINRYDNTIFNVSYPNPSFPSIAESAMLAQGGPIGLVGFTSGMYPTSIVYKRQFTAGTVTTTWPAVGTAVVDEQEGATYPIISHGILDFSHDGDPETSVLGKIEFVKLFAKEYASTTQPGIGNVFNKALNDYVTLHAAELTAQEVRVASTTFGASTIGDCALFMPQLQRSVTDYTRPLVADTNPRMATVVAGYSNTATYNTQNMPVHVIPHTQPFDPSQATVMTVNIQTTAPNVRIRVMTPFHQNPLYESGKWFSTTEVTENGATMSAQTFPTAGGSYTFAFRARTPSVYFLVIQAQNPAWLPGIDPPEYRWLQERWIYCQAVNEFVPHIDNIANPDNTINILVVDMDQKDRYFLGGITSDKHREDYFINPALDDEGYHVGVDNPRSPTFGRGAIAGQLNPIPALVLLNKERGEDLGVAAPYKYQYWCSNVYESDAADTTNNVNNETIKAKQRFYGEITPSALKAFQDTKGTVLWFTGDQNNDFPQGYDFQFAATEEIEMNYLSSFVANGGKLWMTSQNAVPDAQGPSMIATPPFMQNTLGATPIQPDTRFTNMIGLKIGTLSEAINDVNIAGGDGANNSVSSGEVDPNGIGSLGIFTWDPTSGPGTIQKTGNSGTENKLAPDGGRTVMFAWPFEAIDHIGNLGADNSGRENVLRQVVDFLRSVPKAANPDPPDKAVGVSLGKTLSWSRVPEAANYRLFLGTDQNTFAAGAGTIIDRDNPSFTPGAPLLPSTKYYWRVDCKNVDDYTIGDVWTFNTVAPLGQAANPVPANGATQIPLNQVLSWTQDPLAVEYDISIFENGVLVQSATNLTLATFTPNPPLNPNRTFPAANHLNYTWRVDERNELGTVNGVIWSFGTITPPDVPTGPDPATAGTNVSSNKTVGWAATTRTAGYDIFIWRDGIDAAPAAMDPLNPFNAAAPVAVGFTPWSGTSLTNTFSPGELNTPNVAYKWQVRPFNVAGRRNDVTTWTFTTTQTVADPLPVSNPFPANGAAGISPSVVCSWDKGSGVKTYDVFFWPSNQIEPAIPSSAAQAGTTFTPPGEPLTVGATYNWRVNGKNSLGVTAIGPLWSFTVGAAQVTGMVPLNGAVQVPLTQVFTWANSAGALSYNVFLWTGAAAPVVPTANVLATVPPVTPQFQPVGGLQPLTLYSWRVDVIAMDGVTITPGVVQTFTTSTPNGAPPPVTGMFPAFGAQNVPVNVTLSWTASPGAVNYDVFLGAGALPAVATSPAQAATTFTPAAPLLFSTTYFWRVDARNANGVTQSVIAFFVTAANPAVPPPPAPGPGGGGGGGGCFIATSAYAAQASSLPGIVETNCTGRYILSPERERMLNDIRGLRDGVLFNLSAGRAFSAWYYAVGPYPANVIRDNEPAKAAVRTLFINPLSEFSRFCTDSEK